MSTHNDVTTNWQQRLSDNLALLMHAQEMIRKAKSIESSKVIAVAIVTLEIRVATELHHLGGLASAW